MPRDCRPPRQRARRTCEMRLSWRNRSLAPPFEKLHLALVPLGGLARAEGAQVPALAGLRIHFARVEAILSGLEFADHGSAPYAATASLALTAFFLAFLGWLASSIACFSRS